MPFFKYLFTRLNRVLYILTDKWVLLALSFLAVLAYFSYTSIAIEEEIEKPSTAEKIEEKLHLPIHGIDISHYQRQVDFETLKEVKIESQPLQFCFMKATQGKDRQDSTFARNWKRTKEIGLKRGAYHFFSPWVEPELQAENFFSMVELEKGDLPPVIDFEKSGRYFLVKEKRKKRLFSRWVYYRVSEDTLRKRVQTMVQLFEEHYGVKPIIYTNKNHYNRYLKGHFSEYPFWIADYDSQPEINRDSARVLLWQYSQTGRLAGIKGDVDLNVFFGTQAQFDSLLVR